MTCKVVKNLDLMSIELGNGTDTATLMTSTVRAHVNGGTGADSLNGGARR